MPTIDPTFYRCPGDAVAAAPEQLAYVGAFDPTSQQKDALAVVDCDPESTTFGGVVGWTELPTSGNELHHFGWNACSSALCHEGHGEHEALERRYARSGSSLVEDLRPRHQARPPPSGDDPHDRGQRACGQGWILTPAHGALRTRRHLHVGAGWDRRRRRSRRHSSDRPRHVRGHQTWEADRGPQLLAYDVWWHLQYDTVITSEWATPSMIENGLNPEDLLGRKFGHHVNF